MRTLRHMESIFVRKESFYPLLQTRSVLYFRHNSLPTDLIVLSLETSGRTERITCTTRGHHLCNKLSLSLTHNHRRHRRRPPFSHQSQDSDLCPTTRKLTLSHYLPACAMDAIP